MSNSRRDFLKSMSAVAGIVAGSTILKGNPSFSDSLVAAESSLGSAQPFVACNQYTLDSLYRREGRVFMDALTELKEAGIDGFELTGNQPQDYEERVKLVGTMGFAVRSVYTGGNLHEPEQAEVNIERIEAIAKRLAPQGTKIIVINPVAKEAKSDAELILQSKNLDMLGEKLQNLGVTLAYHYHITELQYAAREFTHVMQGTDPEHLALCFDTHWTFRSSGNSAVAVYDTMKMYAPRVVELHLRQSMGGIWTEDFVATGDIDYIRVANYFKENNLHPHLVLEQAPEKETPNTMKNSDIFKKSIAEVKRIFENS